MHNLTLGSLPDAASGKNRRRFPRLRHFVGHPVFGIVIVSLILLSVALILVETFVELPPKVRHYFDLANEIMTAIFIIELSLRWLISKTTPSFLRQFWIDILAVLPMLRIFRVSRVFRLLRLVRVFWLGTLFQRRFAMFGHVFEGRIIEYGIILGFTAFAIVFGTVGFAQFEVGTGTISDNSEAFWKALFTMFAGEYADYPATLGGKVVFLMLLLFGMGAFAMLTGTFSAIMIDKLKESAMHRIHHLEDLSGHIIICGFSAKIITLINELMLEPELANVEILIVSEIADLDNLKAGKVKTDNISILKDDFTRVEVLKRAGVTQARAAVILSESGQNRTYQDIDARTILAALTIEKLNPSIHTSAELYHPEYTDHLRMGGVEDVVIEGDFSGKLLARISTHTGLLGFFEDILSRESGNTISFCAPPDELLGLEFSQAMAVLHQSHHVLLIGVKSAASNNLEVNPKRYTLTKDDQLLIITSVADA